MHYRNGREAKNGDKVVLMPTYGPPIIGILYDAVAGNDTCNGRIAPIAPSDPCPNLKECLHLDDVKAAVAASLQTMNELQAEGKPSAAEGELGPSIFRANREWPIEAEPHG